MLFSQIETKRKNIMTEFSYQDYLANYVVGLLKYNNVPIDSYGLRCMDLRLLKEGQAAIYWSSYFGKWVAGAVVFTGVELNEYGLLKDCSCFDDAGHEDTFTDWSENEKCFVIFNNRCHDCDINIMRYADLFSKIDISLNANIVNSRMMPIVLCKDSNIAEQITEIIEKNHDGATEVVTSKNADIRRSMLGDTGNLVEVINITDVNASDKIQYLNHAHDDLLRRFLSIYGLSIAGTGKMAQQSVEEVDGNDNVALVIPYEMVETRNETLKRFSEVTGIECSCELAEMWDREDRESEAQTDKAEAEADKLEAEAEATEEAPAEEAPAEEEGSSEEETEDKEEDKEKKDDENE